MARLPPGTDLASIAGPDANKMFLSLLQQSDVGDGPQGLVAPTTVGNGLHNVGAYIHSAFRDQARAAERKDLLGQFSGAAASNQAATSSLLQSAGAGPSGAPSFATGMGATAAPKPVAPMASLPGPAPQQKPMAPTPDSTMGPVDAPSPAPSAPSFATGLKSVPDTGTTAPPVVDLRGQGGPASIRNNNPGAMYPGPSATKFGSTAMHVIGGGHKIAEFPDAVSGAAAQFDLLNRNYAGMPVSQAITKWSGGNSSPSYIASVSKDIGLDQNAVLTHDMLRNPKVAVPFARSMARVEAGRDYPLDDAGWNAAHARAFGTQTPNVQVADASGSTVPGGSPMATPPPMSGGVPAGITPRSVQSVPVPRGFAGQALPSAPAPAPAQAPQAQPQPQQNNIGQSYQQYVDWANQLRSNPAYLRASPEQRQVLESMISSKNPFTVQQAQTQADAASVDLQLKQQQFAQGGNKFQEIGVDTMGAKQYGFVDAVHGTVRPYDQPGSSQANGTALHGDEYLKTLDPTLADEIKGYAEGRIPYSPTMARNPRGMALTRHIMQYDPSFDAVQYAARNKAYSDFYGGKGAENLKALETGIQHLDGLDKAIDAIGNNNTLPSVTNPVMNAVRGQFSGDYQKHLADFETHRSGVAGELGKIFKGTGAPSLAEVEDWTSKFGSNSSSVYQKQATRSALEMMMARMNAQIDAYNRGTNGHLTMADVIKDPKVMEIYKRLSGGESADNAPVKVGTPEEAAKLPPGTKFMTPDGEVRVRH